MYQKKLDKYYVIMEFYGVDENTGEYRLLAGVREFSNAFAGKAFYEHVIYETERLMKLAKEKYIPYEKISFMRGGRSISVWKRKLAGHYYSLKS